MIVCKEVIVTDLELRGNGEAEAPYRRITQVYEKDGTLIAENDPISKYDYYDLINFAKWCYDEKIPKDDINISCLKEWMKAIS